MIDPGEGLLPIAAEQVERSPTERRRDGGGWAVEKAFYVIDELLPSAERHFAQRTVRMQPGEALGPRARDAAVMLDNRGAFFFCLAPGCGGAILRQRRRGRFFPLF